MTVFKYNIKRLLRNKVQILVMLLLPFLPIIPIVTGTSASDFQFKIGIVNYDNTKLTTNLIDNLKQKCIIKNISEKEILKQLASSSIDYALVIDSGYTDSIIKGEDASIRGFGKKEDDISKLINIYLDSYINPIKTIALSANKDESTFYLGIDSFNNGNITMKLGKFKKVDKLNSKIAWGMIIMFIMFSSSYATTQLINDKENKTLFRTLTAPIRIKNYMLQSVLSYLVLSIVQITVLVLGAVYVFGLYPGISIINIFLLLLVFTLVSVSIGVAVSSFVKNSIQASVIGIGIALISSMLGGAWGADQSEMMNNIGMITPVYWVMEGVKKLLNSGNLSDLFNEIVILLIFSLVFFMLGTWRREDIAK